MADISSIFILLAVLSGNSDASFSLMELATFDSMETCQKAATSFQAALSEGKRLAEIGCVPASAFAALRGK
ncbi:MAG TPA: hypothetical protein VFB16_04480 [Bauldia sp.]|nr:hypothetical protein [Bauldia sp.]